MQQLSLQLRQCQEQVKVAQQELQTRAEAAEAQVVQTKTQVAQAQAELQAHAEYADEEGAAARAKVEAQATEMKARLHVCAVQGAKTLAVQSMERKAAEVQAALEDKRTNMQAQLDRHEEEQHEWTALVKRAGGVR